MIEAFTTIFIHMTGQEGNPEKSIVLSSTSDGAIFDGNMRFPYAEQFKDWIDAFFDLGVPMVFSAGNMAGDDGQTRPNIDLLPMGLASDDYPIINVGAAKLDGTKVPQSQGGPKLSIYAPGFETEVQGKEDGEPEDGPLKESGTSICTYTWIFSIQITH
jgi:hypothetical protein